MMKHVLARGTICLIVLAASALLASEPLDDTDYVRGKAEGRLAAQGKGMDAMGWGCGCGGCGGCCIGGLAPISTPLLAIPMGLGGGAVGGIGASLIAVKGDLPPAAVLAASSYAMKPEMYQVGFREGYSSAIKSIRTRNVITGTVLGAGTAIASLLAFVYLIYPNIETAQTARDRSDPDSATIRRTHGIRLAVRFGHQ